MSEESRKTSQKRYDIRPQSKGISEKARKVQKAVTTEKSKDLQLRKEIEYLGKTVCLKD